MAGRPDGEDRRWQRLLQTYAQPLMNMKSPQLLFESRMNIAAPGGASAMEGKLRFVQGRPKVHAEPVLVGDTEADRGGAHDGSIG